MAIQQDTSDEYYDDGVDYNNLPPTGYLRWRSDPAAIKRGFGHITKDLPLANLDDNDLMLLRAYFDLLQQNLALVDDKIVRLDDVAAANDFLEAQINVICNSSVARKGYGRSLDSTAIQVKDVKHEDVTKKGKMMRGYR